MTSVLCQNDCGYLQQANLAMMQSYKMDPFKSFEEEQHRNRRSYISLRIELSVTGVLLH